MKRKPLRIGKVTIGDKRPVFILGPCVIESEKFARRMANRIAEICAAEDIDFIFKASYDKANRTSVRSFRGIGVHEGCEILSIIGKDLKIPVTTDVHSPAEAEIAGEKIDMDLPIVIEIVDTEEKVNAFLPVLDEMMGGGLVTLERAKVIRYQDQEKR